MALRDVDFLVMSALAFATGHEPSVRDERLRVALAWGKEHGLDPKVVYDRMVIWTTGPLPPYEEIAPD